MEHVSSVKSVKIAPPNDVKLLSTERFQKGYKSVALVEVVKSGVLPEKK